MQRVRTAAILKLTTCLFSSAAIALSLEAALPVIVTTLSFPFMNLTSSCSLGPEEVKRRHEDQRRVKGVWDVPEVVDVNMPAPGCFPRHDAGSPPSPRPLSFRSVPRRKEDIGEHPHQAHAEVERFLHWMPASQQK